MPDQTELSHEPEPVPGPRRMVSRRTALLATAGSCLLGAAGVSGAGRLFAAGHTTSPNARRDVDPRAVSSVSTSERKLAITFDDGPDPQFTPTVLATLANFDIKATFFLIGRNATRHPDLVAEVLAQGHAVGNHTLDHMWLDDLDVDGVRYEVREGHHSLTSLKVTPGDLFRPPHGWTSSTVAAVTSERNLRSYFWSDCLEAHFNHGIHGAADKIIGACQPGSIILCHDGGALEDGPNPQHEDRSRTVAALPRMLEGILNTGWQPVTLPELMRTGQVAG